MNRNSRCRSPHSAAYSRRQFLSTTATAGAAAFGAPALLRGRNLNEKLDVAIIGCGGRGAGNMNEVASENIVALCDVNEEHVQHARAKHPGAPRFSDFRRMYDELQNFDAVVVSTTEHTHAFATLPALQLQKHVYCEKPLTHNVWEARVISEAAARAGVATQMGTQVHATENYRRVVELVQSGAIGPVREAHVWVSRAWGLHPSEGDAERHGDVLEVRDRPARSEPVPPGMDWDLWLGPAPERPFHSVYVPGPKWYRWWDFGSGTMSDLGSHWVDLPFWALELDHPLTIEAAGPEPHPEIAPASMQVRYEYGPRGDRPATALSWYQGVNKPALWTEGAIPKWENGVLFIGDGGMLLADYAKYLLLPEEKFAGFTPPPATIPPSLGHYAEWIHAAKTGAPTTCHFDYAGKLTEANHLGNVAFRVGKKLRWDAEKLTVQNASEAEPLIRRKYRAGWNLA